VEKKVAKVAQYRRRKEHVMSRVSSRSWLIPAALAGLVVLGTTAGGQTPQQPNQDALGASLVEVRALRSAIEQMTTVGPSIQLAMGRLQLQEQRINTIVRRADVLRDALSAAHKRAGELRDRVGNMQRAFESSTEPLNRSAIEGELPIVKQDLARATAEVQRLQQEESEAAAQVSAEQTRWAEINQRLEELDRALMRR
jgi:chromosome segregation ATPase